MNALQRRYLICYIIIHTMQADFSIKLDENTVV